MEEKPFSGFMEFLTSGTAESGGSQQSQETQMSSQGFSAALACDPDLFGGIKTEEWDDILTPTANSSAEPVSPVSTASIESMGMEAVDGSLIPAFEASLRKGTVTPLLKQELRCKIQKKRVEAGLDPDLPPREELSESGTCQVSEESRRRQEVRKMRNREAAKRCRLKKHAQERELKERARRSEEENRRLKLVIEQNRISITQLQNALHSHICVTRPPRLSSPNF